MLCRSTGSGDADAIITELVEHQILTSDGRFYTLSHAGWVSSLAESLGAETVTLSGARISF